MKIYYAHSISLYNSKQESRDVELLSNLGFEVLNPNTEEHDVGYQERGMDHFSDVVSTCDALAFRAHPDGSIPSGVAWEINVAQKLNKSIIELPNSIQRRTLTHEQTREYLRDCGYR